MRTSKQIADEMKAVVKFERRPCPTCGAVTLDEAATKCAPTQDQSGEWECEQGEDFDDAGFALGPTSQWLKLEAEYWNARNAEFEAEHA